MSHFSVLVIGQNPEEQLRPYHEFECTGIDDEYVQEIDETAELRERYESATRRRLRDPEGKLLDPWGDEFYRDPTPEELEKIGPLAGTGWDGGMTWSSKDWGDGLGYRKKIREVPPEMEEVEVPVRDLMTFREYVAYETGRPERAILVHREDGSHWRLSPDNEEGKYGFTEVTDLGPEGEVARSVDRTNPNKRWDYWTVGGRWKGFLLTDEGPANYALAGDVRFDRMRDKAGEAAQKRWELAHEIIDGREWERWADLIEGLDKVAEFDEARERYRDQLVVRDFSEAQRQARQQGQGLRDAARVAQGEGARLHEEKIMEQAERLEEIAWYNLDDFAATLDEYVAAARRDAVVTFAVVKEGEWFERGKMGWWACVSDEMSRDEWAEKFGELVDGLDPETPLTVVDCHI